MNESTDGGLLGLVDDMCPTPFERSARILKRFVKHQREGVSARVFCQPSGQFAVQIFRQCFFYCLFPLREQSPFLERTGDAQRAFCVRIAQRPRRQESCETIHWCVIIKPQPRQWQPAAIATRHAQHASAEAVGAGKDCEDFSKNCSPHLPYFEAIESCGQFRPSRVENRLREFAKLFGETPVEDMRGLPDGLSRPILLVARSMNATPVTVVPHGSARRSPSFARCVCRRIPRSTKTFARVRSTRATGVATGGQICKDRRPATDSRHRLVAQDFLKRFADFIGLAAATRRPLSLPERRLAIHHSKTFAEAS